MSGTTGIASLKISGVTIATGSVNMNTITFLPKDVLVGNISGIDEIRLSITGGNLSSYVVAIDPGNDITKLFHVNVEVT